MTARLRPASDPRSHQSCILLPGTEGGAHLRLCLWVPNRGQSVNHLYGRRGSRSFLTPAARRWKQDIAEYVNAEALIHGFPMWQQLHAARISYVVVGVKGDADNYAKALLDSIADGLGVNDRCFQLAGAQVERPTRGIPYSPGVRLTIEALCMGNGGAA